MHFQKWNILTGQYCSFNRENQVRKKNQVNESDKRMEYCSQKRLNLKQCFQKCNILIGNYCNFNRQNQGKREIRKPGECMTNEQNTAVKKD